MSHVTIRERGVSGQGRDVICNMNMEDVRTCGQGPRLLFTVYGCGWRDGKRRGIPMEDVRLARWKAAGRLMAKS